MTIYADNPKGSGKEPFGLCGERKALFNKRKAALTNKKCNGILKPRLNLKSFSWQYAKRDHGLSPKLKQANYSCFIMRLINCVDERARLYLAFVAFTIQGC